MPETRGYITYDGSMTEPGCQETVTWIIMNKPIYVTPQQLQVFRKLVQGEEEDPRAPLGGNFRPAQPLNGRSLRTNIFVSTDKVPNCRISIYKLMKSITSSVFLTGLKVSHHTQQPGVQRYIILYFNFNIQL